MRTRMSGGVGGGSREASPYPDWGPFARNPSARFDEGIASYIGQSSAGDMGAKSKNGGIYQAVAQTLDDGH